MLAFEWDSDAETVIIAGDADGLRSLARTLETLAARAETGVLDHDHLFTPTWGGSELSEHSGSTRPAALVHHVKIYGVPVAGSRPA